MNDTLEQIWRKEHAKYKKEKGKLNFSEWWVLTGLIEKEQSWIEAEIEEKKETLKSWRDERNGGYYSEDFINEKIAETRDEIKQLKKDLKQLETISKKLHY